MIVTGSFLGRVRQQFGKAIVGASWKGINYVRQYVKPANPRTTGQIDQRSLFSSVQLVALSALITIIHKFWKKQAIGMSGYNAFMRKNLLACSSPFNASQLIWSAGSMLPTAITLAEYNTATGTFKFSWNPTPTGNQQASDKMCFIIYDVNTNLFNVFDDGTTRSMGTVTYSFGAGYSFSDLRGFMFAYSNLGTVTELISVSTEHDATEP